MSGPWLALALVLVPQAGGNAELERVLLADVRAWTAAETPPPHEDVEALLAEAEGLAGASELVSALGALGHRLGEVGREAEARAVVAWVATRAGASGDRATQAWALDWLAQSDWVRGELDSASERLERAAEVEHERGAPREHTRHLADVARIRLTQGRFEEAFAALARAEDAARGDSSSAATRLAAEVRGSLLFELGRHREALELCLEHARGPLDDGGADEASVRLEILASDVLADVGRLESALLHAERARALARDPEVERTAPLLELEATLALGLLLGDLGRTDEALALLDEAAAEFARLGDERGSAWAAKNRAFALFAAGRGSEALAGFERAWNAGAELGVPFLEGVGALGVAEALAYGSAPDDERLQAALLTAERVAHARHERQMEWRIAAVRGRRHLARGDAAAALVELQRALVLIERWRRRLGASGLVEHALRQRSDPYRDAAFAAAMLGRAEESLVFAALLQARVLDELCARSDGPLASASPAVEARRARLGELEFRAREGVGDVETLRADLERTEDELDAALLAAELASTRTLGSPGERLPLARLRDGLRAQGLDVALAYLVGERETLVLRIDAERGEPEARLLPAGRVHLSELVARLRGPIGRLEAGELDLAHLDFDARAARELHDLLVRPLALSDGARVALVRDEVLGELPFELLVTGGELGAFDAARPFGHLSGLRYLGDEHALVSYGSLARLCTPPHARAPGCTVFLAPAALGVPFAEEEARAIERVAAGLGGARIVRDARPADLADARESGLVHVAAHGRVDPARPAHGHLVLGAGEGGGAARLEAWQAGALALGDATVVLSACHSGRGAWRAGAGLLGLMRGFHLGGAREVVASAWAVDGRVTARFMELFYAELARGHDTPEALRLARLALRGADDPRGFALAHPCFWAGWFAQR